MATHEDPFMQDFGPDKAILANADENMAIAGCLIAALLEAADGGTIQRAHENLLAVDATYEGSSQLGRLAHATFDELAIMKLDEEQADRQHEAYVKERAQNN